MHKKYQELPAQFIPKHSHKYQLKKTLINTKFQWLMKYIQSEKQDSDPKLSRAINIKQKTAIPFAEKRNLKPPNVNINPKQSSQTIDEEARQLIKCDRRSEKGSRPSLTSSKSTPDQHIFMDKQKLRCRGVFSRNMTRQKKAATFFEKENQRVESSTRLQRCKKVKTQVSLERSKTRMEAQAKFDREPFVLSPWMFTEENIENGQQFKF